MDTIQGWLLLKVRHLTTEIQYVGIKIKTVLLEYSHKVNVQLEHDAWCHKMYFYKFTYPFTAPKEWILLLDGNCRQNGGINIIPPDVVIWE